MARLVGGRYRITGSIASGGMGEVYRAHDEVLGRTVALKVLRANLGADPDFVDRFRREAMNAARLSHPAIVQVYDWGRDDADAYMAMEFVDGQNLREVLNAQGALPPATVARIAYQICAALETARKAGIVHRDIKPENILITADGGVKVADFGLARALAESHATQAGVVLGTAAYLAPEQVQGLPVDHRADQYALGCLIFEMLTARPPFEGDNPAAVAYRRVNEEVPSPGDIVASTPPALDAIVRRATARYPSDRYGSAGEMADAIRAAFPDVAAGPVDIDVHHTTAIPIAAQDTIQIMRKRGATPKQQQRRRQLAVIAVLVLVAVSVPLALRANAKVTIPHVAGTAKDAAVARLKKLGFDVSTQVQPDNTVPNGDVISTQPAEGSKIKKGSAVTVVYSSGPAYVTVPDVMGKSVEEAQQLLTNAGLQLQVTWVFNDAKAHTVIDQQPRFPNTIAQNQKVQLTVSKGPQLIVVPKVKGKKQQDATTALQTAGFQVTVQQQPSDTVQQGFVIDSTPKEGAQAPKGSTVTLMVSSGTPLATVPNLKCMTQRQAQDALAQAGFQGAFSGSGRYAVDQDPTPGSQAHKGSTVTVYMGSGAFLGCG